MLVEASVSRESGENRPAAAKGIDGNRQSSASAPQEHCEECLLHRRGG